MKRGLLALLFLCASAQAMQPPPPKPPGPLPAASPLPAPPAFVLPDDPRLFCDAPDVDGVSISPADGKIEPFATFSLSFPTDIVGADVIDQESAQAPITIWPPLDASFIWRSPAEGDWTVTGARIPGQTYRVRLREDLQAIDGSPIPIAAWGAALKSDPLRVSSWYEERSHLHASPQVPLEFNYPVRIHDVAEGIWFQDRATRKRFPAQIVIGSDTANPGLPTPTTIRATPRDPLPVGATYDLVVENVFDAHAGRTLPYPRVFPLGTTRPLAIDFVAARNWATGKPHIEIKFKTSLADAPLTKNAVSITPPLGGFSLRKDGDSILVDGNFDTSVRYQVTVSQDVIGDRGFPLPAPSVWGATFRTKPPTILFPPGEFRQRAALGLRFALVQCNTGPVTWRLAKVPAEKLASVQAALAQDRELPSPLAVDTLGQAVVGTGSFPAVDGDKEELRKIEYLPASPLGGPYLIEAQAVAADGRTIANRALIWFGELALTQKLSPTDLTIRAAAMGTGEPAAGVRLRLLTQELLEIASSETAADGLVRFPQTAAAAAAYFETSQNGTVTLWPASPDGQFPSGSTYFSPQPSVLGKILTDRPIYRPGQELKIKGFVRVKKSGALTIPVGQQVAWEITKAWQDEVVASGSARVNPSGGWDAAWTAPAGGSLGEFRVRAKLGLADAGSPAAFQIEEFRNPPFSVHCGLVEPTRPAESTIAVASRYFHGAANAGARVRWKVTWLSDHQGDFYYSEDNGGFEQVDLYSQNVKPPVYDSVVEGETALNGDGLATISCAAGFPDPGNRANATALWQVDVTGPDGQTLTGGVTECVVMNEVTLGVREAEDSPDGMIRFDTRTVSRTSGSPVPKTIPASLFLVETKSVKEQIAPFVYRYRNFDEFTPKAARNVPADGTADFPAREPGRYVLVVGPAAGGMSVSAEAVVTGPGESEFPVSSDESLTVIPPKDPVLVGQNATFDVLAPSGGLAWVTVETDRILDSRTVEIPGNATKIEIPTRSEFGPNAWVSVYILRPGGRDGIPGEMFGFAGFPLKNPAQELDVQPSTSQATYEPREKISGVVSVTCGGRPVAGAEVTVYAVDDAILELGGWSLPSLAPDFFPPNSFNIITSPALRGLVSGIRPDQLTQKGFTVGDGGGEDFGNIGFTRKDFKPILFWNPSMKSGPDGKVSFESTAPENLTRFRVIAIAQSPASQFGSASATFEVTKNLLIEPALPRFLRQGDEVELRAVARQKLAASAGLAVTCHTDLEIIGPDALTVAAANGAPAVVRFPARVPEAASEAKIRFGVSAPGGHSDAVEVTLPVLPRTITVSESVSGSWSGPTFLASDFFPAAWAGSRGTFETTLSTSPYLAKLLGVPAVLDYPHGCLEQQSSRILAFTALNDLLKWIPANPGRDANYRRTIAASLQAMEASLLPNGTLPYWPMGTTSNLFVTIQSALAVARAEEQGIEVPERLSNELSAALQAVVARTIPTSPTLRAFALFVAASSGGSDGLEAAADDLYIARDRLTHEGKALLALAFHELGKDPEKQKMLAGELPDVPGQQDFDPETFSSPVRAQAFALLARDAVSPTPAIRSLLEKQLESSASLSTQENLWLLFAFQSLLKAEPAATLPKALRPIPDAMSPNLASAMWSPRPLQDAARLQISGLAGRGSFVLAARRALADSDIAPVQNGLRLDRMVKNMTDPARTGSAAAPFRLGDEILITFRFQSDRPQSFLALESPLPAGIEVLNPSLALFGKFYQVPDEEGVRTASLSHSEMYDSRTALFFDEFPAGLATTSVLARATAAGTFAWPAAQISPMYDSRFYSRTAPATCTVVSP